MGQETEHLSPILNTHVRNVAVVIDVTAMAHILIVSCGSDRCFPLDLTVYDKYYAC